MSQKSSTSTKVEVAACLIAAAAALAGAVGLVELSASWVRALFCIAALLLCLPLARASGSWAGRRTLLLAVLALGASGFATSPDLGRFLGTSEVRVWNVFHYYLGAEYFGELGYLDLYDAALRADAEGDDYWRRVRRVRDQTSYQRVPRDLSRSEQVRERFSDERWENFKLDVAALQRQRSARAWRSIFTDRGYNASPFWTAIARPLTHFLPARNPVSLKALASLDFLVLTGTFLLIGRAFGARAGWLALLVFTLNPVDRGRLVGGFLQYDWLLALVISVWALRSRKPGWAAAGLAYATLVRVFPVLLVASLLAPEALRWIRSGRLRRETVRFASWFALFVILGLGIGCLTARGPHAWIEFGGNILHHGDHHTFGEQRVGLKHLFTQDLGDPGSLEGNSTERRARFESQETAYKAVALILLGLWAVAVHRRRGAEALLLGLVPFFALLVSSRYYWACLLLIPLLGERAVGGRWRAAGLAVLGGFWAFYLLDAAIEPARYGAYLLFNTLLAAGLLAWLAIVLRRELETRRRAARIGST